MFNVYQPLISNAQSRELNAKGWSGVPWGDAYADITFAINEENGFRKVSAVAEHGLYVHTMAVDANDPEEVFEITNGYGDQSKRTTIARGRSGSVGDVLIDPEQKAGFICASYGYVQMTDEQLAAFEKAIQG